MHLWGYESLAERGGARLAADADWQAYLKQSPDIILKMKAASWCSAVLAIR